MRFALAQKIAAYAMAVVASLPLVTSGAVDYGWIIALAVLASVGWWLEPPLTSKRRFRLFVTIAVALLFAVQVARFIGGAHLAAVGMEFIVALLGIKLMSRGIAADYAQLAIISFMHLIAGTIAVDDLSYAASFLTFVALCPPVLVLSHLRYEMERRFSAPDNTEFNDKRNRLLQSKRVVSPSFLLGTAALSLPILALTAALFVLFPRMGFGLLGKLAKNQATVGFGATVELGDMDVMRNDETIIARLEPLKKTGDRPRNLLIKVRGMVFDEYAANAWKRSGPERWRALPCEGDICRLQQNAFVGPDTTGYLVLLESIEPPVLFLPGGTGLVGTYPNAEGGQPKSRRLTTSDLGVIQYDDVAKVGLRYRVYLTDAPPFGPPPSTHRPYIALPPGSERLIALARRFAGDGSDSSKVAGLLRRLKTEFRYSTYLAGSEANTHAATPLDRFLFTRKTGTCAHFATALTLMLRAVGLPARLVTGFQGADWNAIGGYYALRSSGAHSWTEVFLDGQWVTVDATPAALARANQWRSSTMALLLDALRMNWHKHVVSYDASSQFELAMGVWRFVREKRQEGAIDQWKRLLQSSLWGILGAAGLVGVWFARKWFARNLRKIRHERLRTNTALEITQLYRQLDRRLVALGMPRHRQQTPWEYALTLRANGRPFSAEVIELTRRYNEIRFGGRRFQPGERAALRRRIRNLAQVQ